MSAGHLTPKARKLTAWGASPRSVVWTFRGQISGRCAKCRQGDRRGGIQKINEAQRKAKQLGGMTHHKNGGRPGRQARSRAQGSIGVPPVFPIRVQDDDQKLAERTSPRSHSPICSRHSETQARRLCYLGLGVMPPLRPIGESSQNVQTPGLGLTPQAVGFRALGAGRHSRVGRATCPYAPNAERRTLNAPCDPNRTIDL